jgi:hypothetical protein
VGYIIALKKVNLPVPVSQINQFLPVTVTKIPGFRATVTGMLIFCFFLLHDSAFTQDTIPGKEPGYLVLAGGVYSCLDLWASTGFVNIQVQPGKKLWVLQPQGGVLVSFSGACMIYGGFTYPAMPAKWLVIQTGAAVGYYESGKGIRLGFPVEFRLSLSVLYRFGNYTQLGLEFAHISNSNLSTHNPGTESFSVIFQIPMRKRRAY